MKTRKEMFDRAIRRVGTGGRLLRKARLRKKHRKAMERLWYSLTPSSEVYPTVNWSDL